MENGSMFTSIKTTIPIEEYKKMKEEVEVKRAKQEQTKQEQKCECKSKCDCEQPREIDFLEVATELAQYSRGVRRKVFKATRLFAKAVRIIDKVEEKTQNV